MTTKRTIIILHRGYGCDTGCCGHAIEIDGEEVAFASDHPDGKDRMQWAKDFLTEQLGAEHVKDLDFENCIITDG